VDREQFVWLLWHGDDVSDQPLDVTLLGVYSSPERAEARKAEASALPGYRDFPDAFVIDRHEINKDQWAEGFVIVDPGKRVLRPDAE
jgi:hypothetical protein